MDKNFVLLLDDEEGVRQDLGNHLRRHGFDVHTASSIDDAKRIITADQVDYAVVDLKVDFHSETGGIEVVHFLKRNQPQAHAIILSAHDFDRQMRDEVEGELDGFVPKGGPENYILAILKKLRELEAALTVKRCFVIMPFSGTKRCASEEWDEIFKEIIRPAVEGSGGRYECERSRTMVGNIIDDLLDNLNRADLVIADLTDRNPNVFYELGVRHALRGGTILIAQSLDDVPFDLRPYAIHAYNWRLKRDREIFAQRLQHAIREIESNPARGESPVLKYLGRSAR